jgi:hypothetical protein
MNTQRKLQLGAAAVIANGIVALGTMAPVPAVAAACNSHALVYCHTCNLSLCQPVSGCTLTALCLYQFECPTVGTICFYN